jgi:hypothetical protein
MRVKEKVSRLWLVCGWCGGWCDGWCVVGVWLVWWLVCGWCVVGVVVGMWLLLLVAWCSFFLLLVADINFILPLSTTTNTHQTHQTHLYLPMLFPSWSPKNGVLNCKSNIVRRHGRRNI